MGAIVDVDAGALTIGGGASPFITGRINPAQVAPGVAQHGQRTGNGVAVVAPAINAHAVDGVFIYAIARAADVGMAVGVQINAGALTVAVGIAYDNGITCARRDRVAAPVSAKRGAGTRAGARAFSRFIWP